MKTRDLILKTSLENFNKNGINSVSLRDIAKNMGISYGNLTYHFANKENIITWQCVRLIEELDGLHSTLNSDEDVFEVFNRTTAATYDIFYKYLFLFQDYVEINRHFPSIAAMLKQIIGSGKSDLLNILTELRNQDFLRQDIGEIELNHLLDIQADLKNMFFINLSDIEKFKSDKKHLKAEYVEYVNKLIFPYLTIKGIKLFYKSV